VSLTGDGLGAGRPGPLTEVVVTLDTPPLASFGRSLQSAAHAGYARRLALQQATVVARVQRALPAARVRWRYHLVLDGFAVALPRSELTSLSRVPGVARVWPNVRYHALRSMDGVAQIGANQLWGAGLATAGQGIKIGIIDDGLDASNPYFDPAGFTYPPGFPKGQKALATPKVIVQRAFSPPGETWRYKNAPFDPANSFHATHVAGIAAGDNGTRAGGTVISGVAPEAQLGNYKALTVPTPDFGLDGGAAELAAAIEAAVADGMNVINLSLGEPEVEPSRDLVVQAIDNAAKAGVVPVVAAGNDFDSFGYGTVSSPGSAPDAITAAAADSRDVIAYFSSAGPTAISLGMKPDVTAPGVGVLSSLPARQGTFGRLDGTSMAAPHVAGAAALLKQRHPTWTVGQIKSALVQTGDPVHAAGGSEAPSTREGGGLIDLPRADVPLLFASPTGLSFGRLAPGAGATRPVTLTDAGGGAGDWAVTTVVQAGAGSVAAPATVTVPGTFAVTATAGSQTGDVAGFVVLRRDTDVRRIPFWFAVSAPQLGSEPRTLLTRPGVVHGTTVGGRSLVIAYRYPTAGASYLGPERVYRVRVGATAANVGVVVLSGHVTPHVTFDGAEDHLAGYAGLPRDINPYRSDYGRRVPVAGAVLPGAGTYDFVFDTRSAADAGRFTFRWWINDTTPPALTLRSMRGGIAVAARDAGAGVDPHSIEATVDGKPARVTWRAGVVHVAAARGRQRLVLSVADYQETKNMEDVPATLPNTATLRATVRVR
jgi:subtilisin family serine protease